MRQLLSRLDQIACAINIWLLAVAIGLGVLDSTVFVSKGFETLALAAPPASLSPVGPEAPPH